MFDELLKAVKGTRVFEVGLINPTEIEYRQEIRDICLKNTCRQYGKTWACPPAVGTLEECRKRCCQYENMLVFTNKYNLENSFDYDGMMNGLRDFKAVARELETAVKPYLNNYIVLSNESCDTCANCTYPDFPCRFPEQLHHSIEGYGILVNDLAQKAKIRYNNGENTVTYFGAILFNG